MNRFFLCAAAAALLAFAPHAQAVNLTPGTGATALSGISLPAGTMGSFGSQTLSNVGGGIGLDLTLRYGVYDIGGLKTFLYQITTLGDSDAVSRLTVSSFAGFTTDVSFITAGSVPAALTAAGFVNANPATAPVTGDRL